MVTWSTHLSSCRLKSLVQDTWGILLAPGAQAQGCRGSGGCPEGGEHPGELESPEHPEPGAVLWREPGWRSIFSKALSLSFQLTLTTTPGGVTAEHMSR